MKNNHKWLIIPLAAVLLAFAGFYLHEYNAAREYEAQQRELQLLNYEATEYCLRLAMAFCDRPEIQTILGEGTDMAHPPAFEGTRAILGIHQMKRVTDAESPFTTFYVDYFVPDFGQIQQTVLLTKVDRGEGVVWWTFDILGYRVEEG